MRHTHLSRRSLLAYAAGLACASSAAPALAAKYPAKPIRVVVPFGAGGSLDVICRLWGDRIAKATGQSVVVENRVGASSIIGTQAVATAPADGYNLLYTGVAMSINPLVYDKLPYKAEDFVPVIRICSVPFVFIVSANSKIKTLKDLVDMAKAKPGSLSFGHYGVGQLSQVALVMLMNMAGISLLPVPYKSASAAVTDLIGDRLDVAIDASTTAIPSVQAGRLRALAITGPQRLEGLPGVPTVSESYPGFTGSSWQGVFAPRGTPDDAIATLNALSRKIVEAPDFRAMLHESGLLPAGGTVDDFRKFLVADVRSWAKVVKDNGIKAD
ncbi:MAG TPA: tripartite tricarboxylate transporter substrate binding protein [Ramlibacter sp.]|uniref:Bug family tripartite tricarboxylate transporter substrate binding protein n=1 Tax=Ramlibacter sp. TaxID=1917967 RepID=UPI002C3999A2|nr:tripartite tricarboxylate transporter substrate binding protein [Ramlibacter sp.]HVZ45827.1 tripartite tricarboxylate transporter substrate binding protein [Ramlibacter sp.]